MHDPIGYLCGIDDPEKIRKEALAYNVKILTETHAHFVDHTTKTQFFVEFQGLRGLLVPASDVSRERQRLHGRYLAPYSWVLT